MNNIHNKFDSSQSSFIFYECIRVCVRVCMYMYISMQYQEQRKCLHESMLRNFEQDITSHLAAEMESVDTEERLRFDPACRDFKDHEKLRDSILEEVNDLWVMLVQCIHVSHILLAGAPHGTKAV